MEIIPQLSIYVALSDRSQMNAQADRIGLTNTCCVSHFKQLGVYVFTFFYYGPPRIYFPIPDLQLFNGQSSSVHGLYPLKLVISINSNTYDDIFDSFVNAAWGNTIISGASGHRY